MDIPESFQDRLEEYNRNFEHLTDLLGEENTLTEASAKRVVRAEETKNLLSDALPIGIRSIVQLAASADSETVRLAASKYIVDANLGKEPALQSVDPTKDLITRLQEGAPDG